MGEKTGTNDNEAMQGVCCTDGSYQGCCLVPPEGGSESRDSSFRSWRKTITFTLVVLIALGAGAYSLYNRSVATAQGQGKQLLSNAGLEQEAGPSTIGPVTENRSSESAAISCGHTLSSIKAIGEQAVDKEVVFIFLPGGDEGEAQALSRQVEKVVEMLSSKGKRVAAFTLPENADGYGQLKEKFSVKSFPSVIVAGWGCRPAKLETAEITESNLLFAFVQASMPSTSCETPCQ